MKTLVLILNKVDLLDKLLNSLSDNGITGGTILNSTGMAKSLAKDETSGIFGSLRLFLDPNRKESKTLLFVQNEETILKTIKIIKSIVDLSKPDSGIIFTMPIDFVEGLKF